MDPRFIKGLELFNRHDFYECHEIIESLWLQTPSEDGYRDLYKGVIQAAAALYQFQRGILSGARSLYRTSVAYLGKYAPRSLGLDVSRLMEDLRRCFEDLEKWDGRTDVTLKTSGIPKLEYEAT